MKFKHQTVISVVFSVVNVFAIIGEAFLAPRPTACPLSGIITRARNTCTAEYAGQRIRSGGSPDFFADFIEGMDSMTKNPDLVIGVDLIEKFGQWMLCLAKGTGIITDDGGMFTVNIDKLPDLFQDGLSMNPTALQSMESGAKDCQAQYMGGNEIEIPVCVIIAIDKACEYGFLRSLSPV